MRSTLLRLWESANSSYWLPPSAMTAGAMALAVAMLYLDASVNGVRDHLPWVYSGGPDGAREVLGTIAASMMTVLSVTFSVTIVALTVASQQFGPRVLHSFVGKPGPQVVLGSFIGTFIYSLIVLRTVTGENGRFVPHLAVSVGVVLAGASIAALIYFIHHVSASIQSSTIITEIAADLERAIDHLFPDRLARGEFAGEHEAPSRTSPGQEPPASAARGEHVSITESGYIQAVDELTLLKLATDCDLVVRLLHRPGEFVIDGEAVATVSPRERLDDEGRRRLQRAILVGPRRTPAQDVDFAFSQLLEIALHALSPAMNEPFLAINCLDRVIAALCHLAERAIPSARRYDRSGALRIIAFPLTFVDAATRVFDVLRDPVAGSGLVAEHVLAGIGRVARHAGRQEDREALARHASLVHAESLRASHTEELRRRVDEAYSRAMRTLRNSAEVDTP